MPTDATSSHSDSSSLQYYVRFTPAGGGTIVGETQDQTSSNPAYALDGFSFGAEQTLGIGSASSGAGAGKATFNPLQLSFDQPALNATLFQMLTSGTHLETVDVYGVQTSGDGVHFLVDYRFEFVLGKTLSFDQSGVTQLSLDYGQLLIRYLPQSVTNPDGTVAGETSFGWNQVENVVDPGSTISGDTTSPPVTTADTAAPAAVDQPAFPLVPGVDTSSLQYYVRFTLSNGTTLTVGGDRLFALDGLSLSAAQSLSIASASGGAGAGKATFNPLHLSFDQPLLNPYVFQMLARGTHFSEVDVLGYNVAGNTSNLAIDYSFGLVLANALNFDSLGETQLDLQYRSQAIRYYSQQPDGSPATMPTTSSAWDVIDNAADFGSSSPLDPPLTLPTDATSSHSDSSSLQYYVRFTPAGGGTIVGETQDQTSSNPAYALDGFSFGAEQTLGIGSASSGAGAGKATFNPLQLSFDQPALNATLFQMLTSGTHLETVDVYGVQTSGDGVHFLVDYRFEFVLGKTLSFDQSGVTQLSLDYGQLLIRYLPQSVTNPDGTVAGETSFGWNQVENVVDPGSTISGDTTSPPVTTADTAAPAAVDQPAFPLVPGVDTSSLQYYVRFTRSDGTTLTVGGDQLFALDGFSFSAAQSLSIASASSGAGAGKVTFNPLHLSFDQPLLNPFLFQDEAMGVAFEEVDVLGYRAGKDTARLLIEYSFEPVIATTMGIDQSGVTQLDLEYGDEQIQYVNHRPLTVDDAANVLAGNSAAGDVLANDSDPDGDALTVSAVGGASGTPGALLAGTYGDLRLNGDGTYSYSADNAAAIAAAPLGGHPHDVFSYTATDRLGGTADANLDITIDRPPVAAPDTNGVLTAETVSGNVLANDSDPDDDGLTVTAISAVGGASGAVGALLAGTYGDLRLNGDGTYSYSADNAAAIAAAPLGGHPHDLFSYTASDGLGGTADASLDITIDRPPVAAPDTNGVLTAETISGNVLANDSDPDGDGLTVTAISAVGGASRTVSGLLAGTYGHLTLNAYGSYTYVADNAAAIAAAPTGSHPLDAFSYTISDGLGATSTATLDIVIDRSPIAANDLAGVQIGKSISGNVLANDRDLDGDLIRVVGLGGGSLGQSVAGKYGTLVLGPDGTYTYVSNKNAQMPSQGVAQDVFAYTEF